MPTVIEMGQQLADKAEETKSWMAAHTVNGQLDLDTAGITEFNQRNNEFGTLTSAFQAAKAAEDAAKKNMEIFNGLQNTTNTLPFGMPTSGTGTQTPYKSLGEIFIESDAFKSNKEASIPRFSFESEKWNILDSPYSTKSIYGGGNAGSAMKATLTDATYAPFSPRAPLVVDYANRKPVIADLIPQRPWEFQSFIYMQITTWTNAAAAVAEGNLKPESALGAIQVTAPMQFIAHIMPVTRQAFEDIPGIMDMLNRIMTNQLLLAEEDELLNGNGTAPNLQGFYTVSGLQTQAQGADPMPTAILKAFTLVRGVTPGAGFAEPSGLILNPIDYQNLLTLQTSTGSYLFGDPNSPEMVQRIWGKPIIATPATAVGQGLTGDFANYSEILRRSGVRIDVSDQHSDYFQRNQLAIRVEMREALAITRPSAFCQLTGLAAH